MNATPDALREALDAALETFRRKLRAGALTMSELRAILEIFAAAGGVSVTASDLAELYGTTEVNVRSVIKRRMVSRPTRRVYYDLLEFMRIVPRKWHISPRPSRPSE